MKKLFLFLLLIPLSISAKANVEANIECQGELTIGSNVDCKLVIDNPYKYKITDVSFNRNNKFINQKSDFELIDSDESYTYDVKINSREESITLLTFSYLLEKNNMNVTVENMTINTTLGKFDQNVSKNLSIENLAYADMIYINNQPIASMNRDVFDYTVNVYERLEYIELKVVTSGTNHSLEEEVKLLRYTPTVSFKVTNDKDTETYNLTFNYKNPETVNEIKIPEIPFTFIPSKKYYYIEVENSINKITIESNFETKEYNLGIGKNEIKFDDNGEIYLFNINRIKSNGKINENSKVKSLKFGNTYLNVKDDTYEYNYVTDKVDLVAVETASNQDYEIKYSENKVKVTVYDAKQNKSEYTINLVEEEKEEKKDVQEYDNSKSIVIFLIFLLSFVLIALVVTIKYKKERID